MQPTYLVTGGGGFIGSHLVQALTAAGRGVRVLDNFSTGLRSNLTATQPPPEVIEGDLTVLADVERACAGVEVVYHLGALASVQRSVEKPLVPTPPVTRAPFTSSTSPAAPGPPGCLCGQQ